MTVSDLEQISDILRLRAEELGLSVSLNEDFGELASHLRSQGAVVNPSFDPNDHDISEGFWIKAVNSDGHVIACHAERVFRTSDFVSDIIESGRLWWGKSEPASASTWRTPILPPASKIYGVVAYAGSMLIAPTYRGIGLSKILPLLSRAIILKKYGTDFHTGIVRQGLASSKVPSENYGFPNIDPIFSGVLPGVAGNKETVFLCWMDKHQAILSLDRHTGGPTEKITV